ncbi:hypothetical protein F5Y13DRAFT_183093 [Hypoxylon sp. FL1857]|nr:hypothetical protein F5Y13DRAFT_183093 [Hypoxylon sp. FL1857]
MNAAASLRASFYGADGSLGLPAQNPRDARRHTVNGDETVSQDSIFEVEQVAEPPTTRDQLWQMFTICPYRDANWIVAIIFVTGSVSFLVNASFTLLSTFAPSTVFPGEIELAIPLTILFGAVMFLSGGTLALVAGWNADKGTFEPVEDKTGDGSTKMYKPALLGSGAWSWIPTAADFKASLRTVPFLSSLVQFSGGLILPISVLFLFAPLSVGGIMFFFANLSLLIWLQDSWYKPKPSSASWQAAFWSTVGSFNFALTGFALFMGDMSASAIATFIGAWTFLVGSVFQWYDLMAFHPDGGDQFGQPISSTELIEAI